MNINGAGVVSHTLYFWYLIVKFKHSVVLDYKCWYKIVLILLRAVSVIAKLCLFLFV